MLTKLAFAMVVGGFLIYLAIRKKLRAEEENQISIEEDRLTLNGCLWVFGAMMMTTGGLFLAFVLVRRIM